MITQIKSMQIYHKWLIPLTLATFFFIIQFITLNSYNISWDEPLHFMRGQAYLHLFLTGHDTYDDLPKVRLQGTNGDPSKITGFRRSLYQDDIHNGRFFLKDDAGHPPLSDEIAAAFNLIFYQRLAVLSDIAAYHLFNILVSSVLVFIVTFFAIEVIGLFPGLITFLSLTTYPLFFSEAHFNVKDPIEATFFSACILIFYLYIDELKVKWLIGFLISFGLALGTKFNILFLPFILLPYLLLVERTKIKKLYSLKKHIVYFSIGAFLVILFFFASWPYLWINPLHNLLNVFGYYKQIGSGTNYQADNFYLFGLNTFPILWILFTTPLTTLAFFFIGIFSLLNKNLSYRKVGFLWLFWFLIPVVRVALPGTSIYGGDRQIFEFIPAVALLCGLGARFVTDYSEKIFRQKIFIIFFVLVLFLWPLFLLFKLHPNQNLYFNSLIGGLKGAQIVNFPSWGNSYGNTYLAGINWLNRNAPANSKFSLIQGTLANLPIEYLRGNLNYTYSNWSGYQKQGEYLMDLIFNNTGVDYYFTWDYVNKFLKPVFEYQVDGVIVLKIWKNDLEHTYPNIKSKIAIYPGKVSLSKNRNNIILTTKDNINLAQIDIKYNGKNECSKQLDGVVEVLDNGKFIAQKDSLVSFQVGRKTNIDNNEFKFYFPGIYTNEIKIVLNSESCDLNINSYQIYNLL